MVDDALISYEIDCPYCATPMTLLIDTSQGSHTTWEDCQRCCAPIQLEITVSPVSGELEQVRYGRDDDVL